MDTLQPLALALEEWGLTPRECGRGLTVAFRAGDDRVVALTLPTRRGYQVRVVSRHVVGRERRLEAKIVLRAHTIDGVTLAQDGRLSTQVPVTEPGHWLSVVATASRRLGGALDALRAHGVVATPVTPWR